MELNDRVTSKLAEVTAAVTQSCTAYRQIFSPESSRTTTIADVEAAERLAWAAHQKVAELMAAHDQVLRSLRLALLNAGARGGRRSRRCVPRAGCRDG